MDGVGKIGWFHPQSAVPDKILRSELAAEQGNALQANLGGELLHDRGFPIPGGPK